MNREEYWLAVAAWHERRGRTGMAAAALFCALTKGNEYYRCLDSYHASEGYGSELARCRFEKFDNAPDL